MLTIHSFDKCSTGQIVALNVNKRSVWLENAERVRRRFDKPRPDRVFYP